MKLKWINLETLKCPMPSCESKLEEQGGMFNCTGCSFGISKNRLEVISIQRDKKLEPPEFIKELRKNK